MAYEGMIAETVTISGNKNEPISAYVARPLGAGHHRQRESQSGRSVLDERGNAQRL